MEYFNGLSLPIEWKPTSLMWSLGPYKSSLCLLSKLILHHPSSHSHCNQQHLAYFEFSKIPHSLLGSVHLDRPFPCAISYAWDTVPLTFSLLIFTRPIDLSSRITSSEILFLTLLSWIFSFVLMAHSSHTPYESYALMFFFSSTQVIVPQGKNQASLFGH